VIAYIVHHADKKTVFIKLGSQLTAETLSDLAIIPVIFVVQTAVSYLCALTISRCCRFKKRQSNFVAAMAVCQSPPQCNTYTNHGTGLWKLQFSPHLPRHVPVPDSQRSPLGSRPE
jgi:hypothetical protein